jgi:putative component of membrane protein insertase Oxa1/YidC/SpoIIIJ protein YidD
MISSLLITFMRLYQRTELARDYVMRSLHFPRHMCKYNPTCSENMIIQIRQLGPMRGVVKGLQQFLRCW